MKRLLMIAALALSMAGGIVPTTGCSNEDKCASDMTFPETCAEW